MDDEYDHRDHIVKINYGGSFRTIVFPYRSSHGQERLMLKRLDNFENRIRGLFKLPTAAQILLTYSDADNDPISIEDDEDMATMFRLLRVGPVRIDVTLVMKPESSGLLTPLPGKAEIVRAELAADVSLKDLLRKLSSNLEAVQLRIRSYETMSKEATSAAEVDGLVENLFQMINIVTSVLSSTVKSLAN